MAVTPGFGIIATAFLTESELSLKTSTSVNVVLSPQLGQLLSPTATSNSEAGLLNFPQWPTPATRPSF